MIFPQVLPFPLSIIIPLITYTHLSSGAGTTDPFKFDVLIPDKPVNQSSGKGKNNAMLIHCN
jgi:hypothetical protein